MTFRQELLIILNLATTMGIAYAVIQIAILLLAESQKRLKED